VENAYVARELARSPAKKEIIEGFSRGISLLSVGWSCLPKN